MKQKIQALVLSRVRHSDTTDVAVLYAKSQGRVSVAVPAPSPRRKRSNPPLMPLSVIETEIDSKFTPALPRMWRFSIIEPMGRLHIEPAKSAIGIFITEFLGHLIKEQNPDPALWQAVVDALRILDAEKNATRVANFHIVLLWQLLAPVGIVPDLDRYNPKEDLWLDMRGGCYTSIRPLHADVLPPQFASLPPTLARLNFRNSHKLILSGEQRYNLCRELLHYYSVHLPGLGNLHSHHILRTLFS